MLQTSPFLELVVSEYFRARRLHTEHPRVTRGESRSVSAVVEDLFATQVANSFPSIEHIYVNQTLTSTAGRLNGRMKPDLVITKRGEIILLIDLKMDLGYKKKEFVDAATCTANKIRSLRGGKVSLWKKIEQRRERLEYAMDSQTLYAYIVVSDGNMNPADYADIKSRIAQFKELRLFTLVTGAHPNNYGITEEHAKTNILDHASGIDFKALNELIAGAASR